MKVSRGASFQIRAKGIKPAETPGLLHRPVAGTQGGVISPDALEHLPAPCGKSLGSKRQGQPARIT